MPPKQKSKKAEKRQQKEEAAKRASAQLFNNFYQQQYGEQRWSDLLVALQAPVRHCALLNKYADKEFAEKLLGIDIGATVSYLPEYIAQAYVRTNEVPPDTERVCPADNKSMEDIDVEEVEFSGDARWPAPGHTSSLDCNGKCCYYPLDAASLFPVKLLDIQPYHRVFDLCAAPGGKSLTILQYLSEAGSLVCSDVSPDRRIRLKNVLRRYISPSMLEHVQVVSGDGTTPRFIDEFGSRTFDRVLVDAPCSSERHVLHSDSELLRWAPGRSKANAERQISLLLTALRLVAAGGRVVYSTCSLSNMENDAVVAKAIKRANKRAYSTSSDRCKVVLAKVKDLTEANIPLGEATSYGWHILPDRSDGWGPIYLSVIDVIEEVKDNARHDQTVEEEDEDS